MTRARRMTLAGVLSCMLGYGAGMSGCGAGIETMGTERRAESGAESETASASEAGTETETASASATASETETASASATESETETASASASATESETETETETRRAPRAQVLVRSTTGPIRPSMARHVIGRQLGQIQRCFEVAQSSHPWIAGSIRAVLRVEASGSASADLETLTPELDVVLPCVDAALERSVFPVTGVSTGGAERSHIFVEVALAAP